ncbi:MAG TPA: RHS repeat-associated core domain-containing protein [Steroidobacteraceae bacterium]|nr:RHS repeat-associated core domain-containing protein [Steroidobacteraceae bacterium]
MFSSLNQPLCSVSSVTDTGWDTNIGASSCWGGGPQYTNGLLTSAKRVKTANYTCTDTSTDSVRVEFLKIRDVKCPVSYLTRTTSGGVMQCFRPAAPTPPRPCCDGKDKFKSDLRGNPVSMLSGAKRETEVDYPARTAGGVRFERYYNSNGYFRIPGVVPTPLTSEDFWNHNYATRLYAIAGNPTLSAVVRRPFGAIQYFDGGGADIINRDGAADRLQSISGIGWNLTLANKDVESFDLSGRLTSITTRAGVVQTLVYDTGGRLATVTDTFGSQLAFGYDTSNRLASVTLPGTQTIYYAYDSLGRPTTVTYPDSTTRQYVYEDPKGAWLLSGVIDESNARFSTFTYDSAGRAISTEHAGGVDRYTFQYGVIDISSMSVTATDAFGSNQGATFFNTNGVFRLGYGGSSQATRDLPYQGLGYDANGNVSARASYAIDASGFLLYTSYQYDLARNLEVSRTEGRKTISGIFWTSPATRTITTQWHPTFRSPTQIEVYAGDTATGTPLRRTTMTYDTAGNLLTRTVTDPTVTPNVSRTWTYTYDSYGKVLTDDGPRTDVSDLTTYAYYNCTTGSQCGQLNTITNALGQVTTYNSYNAHRQPTQITDANGLVTSLAYDLRQRAVDRCLGSTLPGCSGGELTHFEYWPTGLLKKVTNPDGSFIQYTYDAAHRLTQIDDGALNKIVFTLDLMSNRTAENTFDPSNALKRTHTRVFNTLNQLWKDVNAAGTANATTVFGYDRNGNQISANAPLSRNSTTAYDYLERVSQITDPASGNTYFGYDVNDNLTSVTDPRSLTTSYTYTGFGDLKTQTSPDTGLTTNTYDSGGNLKTSTDARNAITTYTYDKLNRVATAAFKIGSTTDQTITYTYDAGTNGKGHLTGASDANHSLSWTYDAKGRIVGKGQTLGTVTKSVGYGYNAFGQLASLVLPSGQTLAYGYDANNQVTSVTLNGSPNVTIVNNITYDPFGPINGWSWGNATTASRTFDGDGKLTQVTSSGQRTFGYDDAFRITAANDIATPANSWTLGYDILDRLNSATKPSTTIGYTYDADGNRLTQTGTSSSTYTIPGTSNKLSSTTGALVRTYTYDAVGNVLTSGATTHTYNNAGRMKTGKLGAATVTTYVYNALGQRVKKSGGAATTTLFMYDEAGHLVGEYNSTGVLVQETVWLGDIPIATIRPKTPSGVDVFYVHTDQLNTPRKVTRPSDNQLRWKWDPTPFGEGTPNENPASLGAFKYNLRFPGQYFDNETNFNYNYLRDYDPAVGRFIESDPAGVNDDLNTYAYVHEDPVASSDPLGLGRATGNPEKYSGKACGSGWNFTLVPDSFRGVVSFTKACKNHDNCYGTCGASKKNCDDKFLQETLDACAKALGAGTRLAGACYVQAHRYHDMVDRYGDTAFQNAQESACKCNKN